MAERAAQELEDGMCINLGIGIQTLVANYIPGGVGVILQAENGMLGIGPFPAKDEIDPDLINASKQMMTDLARTAYLDSAPSFSMIRGGKVAAANLRAMKVSEKGDLANWMTPGKLVKSRGGAMDLVAGVGRVVVVMEHTNTAGESKVLKECPLPLTGTGVMDQIITDLGVRGVTHRGPHIEEPAPGEAGVELIDATEATIVWAQAAARTGCSRQ